MKDILWIETTYYLGKKLLGSEYIQIGDYQ